MVSIALLGCSLVLWTDVSMRNLLIDNVYQPFGEILLYACLPAAIGLMIFAICRDYSLLLDKKKFPFVIHSFDKNREISHELLAAVRSIFRDGSVGGSNARSIEFPQIKLSEDWQQGFHTYWREIVFEQFNKALRRVTSSDEISISYDDVYHSAWGETTISVSRASFGLVTHQYLLTNAKGTVKHSFHSQRTSEWQSDINFDTEFGLIRNSSISVNLFRAIYESTVLDSEFKQWYKADADLDQKGNHELVVITRLKLLPVLSLHDSLYLFDPSDNDGVVPIAYGIYKN